MTESLSRTKPARPGSRADRLDWEEEEATRNPRILPPEPPAILEYYLTRAREQKKAVTLLTETLLSGKETRIAIQKSGRLSAVAWGLLDASMQAAGIPTTEEERSLRAKGRKLVYQLPQFPDCKIILARQSDIPWYVENGNADWGILGEDQILEKKPRVAIAARLGRGESSLIIATPKDSPVMDVAGLNGKTIATSYPRILGRFLKGRGIKAGRIVTLTGSVEAAASLGIADAICDITETGASLKANGLEELETICDFEALLVVPKIAAPAK